MGISALNSALSGLRVSQQQLDVISTNVANVGTPGYSRKTLPQSAQTLQGTGIGVRAETIIRNVDLNLERDLWTQVSAVGQLSVQQSYLQRIEQFHGPPDRQLSVAAEISRLEDSFAALADSPEDSIRQAATVNQAIDTANKINDLAELITTSRNDAQADIQVAVNKINDLLVQIADVNDQVRVNGATGRSTAALEDERDAAIQELSELIEISFFQRGDGVLVVQTNRGVELASETSTQLTFRPTPLGPGSVHPDSAAGIFVGDPDSGLATGSFEITTLSPGGRLGGLLELRDTTFPKQTAQLDEFSHKMALRFEAQGLRLFTNATGQIPADTAPTPELPGPPIVPAVPVTYVGFSSEIQVNVNILNDNSILQSGTATTDLPILAGSNEIISRVLDFTFGATALQQAQGNIDVRVGGGATTLQEWLGVFSENQVTTFRDLSALGDLTTAAGSPFTAPGADTFSITIDPAGEGAGPTGPLNVNISTLAAPSGATELANAITALDPDITASVNANGQLDITSRFDLEIADVNMGTAGFQFLGINPGTYEATDPFIDVQVGTADPVRIIIEPGDTQTELVDKLILDPTIPNDTGVPGLAIDAVTFAATGELILRPGDDFTNPEFGGSLSIISGPFNVDAANAEINVVTPGTLVDGVNIASALFGSFSAGGQDLSPISSISYQSETENGSGVFLGFRENLLGPDLSVSTGIIGAATLENFGQNMVNEQTQELIITQGRIDDEESLRSVLEQGQQRPCPGIPGSGLVPSRLRQAGGPLRHRR